MKKHLSCLLALPVTLAACGGGMVDHEAELKCYTHAIVGDIRPAPGAFAEAVIMKGNRVEAVATSADDVKDVDRDCIAQLPRGAVAFPGLVDGHAHLLGIGLREMTLNLEGTSSVDDLQARLRKAAGAPENARVIYGRGWIETGWPEGRMPVAGDLDAVVADRPVILSRADGHAAVINTAALTAAGITRDTPDPDGGRIVRDGTGEATGLLIDNAENLVAGLLPVLTQERREAALRRGAEVYAARGWTGIHNMSVDPADGDILRTLTAAGELPIRVFNYYIPDALDTMAAKGRQCTTDLHVCDMGIKFYVDGALGSRGALLFEPYADEPSTTGLQLISADDAKAAYKKALASGLQVTTHAIGDRGNDLVLSWYEDFLPTGNDLRWRIEHAQIVRPADITRFESRGVIASMQPSHAIGDFFFAPTRLGDARLDGAYAWQSMLDAGAHIVGGSDAPVEQGDPRIELHAAARRTALNGFSGEDWRMHEALSPDDTLAIFTTEAAHAVFAENELGQLAPGYRADLTVFSDDPFTTSWDKVEVIATYVDGRKVAP